MASSGLIGRAEQEFFTNDPYAKRKGADLGKEDFLTLLVTQLSHQDPLNPMDDKEFVAQLAQFSSLEQLTNISGGIDNLNDASNQGQMISAVGFIGKEVRAAGNSLSLEDGKASSVYFALNAPIVEGYVNIYDSEMNLVRTEALGAKQAGEYEYVWDGEDYSGKGMADGPYYITMAAAAADGTPVMVYTEVSGKVAGVQRDGNDSWLRLDDGRFVKFTEVREVVNTSTVDNGNANDGDDGDDGTGGDGTDTGSGDDEGDAGTDAQNG